MRLDTILASLGKSRHYFETKKDQMTGEWLQHIILKLIKQGERDCIFKDYLIQVK